MGGGSLVEVPFTSIWSGALLRTLDGPFDCGVLRCAKQRRWPELWAELRAGGAVPAPTVDWASEMVLAVVLPHQPSSAYQVRVQRLTSDGHGLRVHARLSEEDGGFDLPMQPCHVIRTETRRGPVELVLRDETRARTQPEGQTGDTLS